MKGGRQRFLYKIMSAMLALVISVLLVTSVTLYLVSYENEKRTSVEFTERLISQVDAAVQNYVDVMESIFDAVIGDELCRSYFSAAPGDLAGISEKLAFTVSTRNDVSDIFLLKGFDAGRLEVLTKDPTARINAHNNYQKSAWYASLFGEDRASTITSSYVQNLIEGRYDWVISLGRKVTGPDGTLAGVILIDLKYSSIIKLCENAMPERYGYVFLLDETGNLVYHPKQQLIYSELMSEETELVAALAAGEVHQQDGKLYLASKLHEANWRVAGVLSVDALLAEQTSMVWFFLATALGFGAIAILISYFASKRVTKPVRDLQVTVQKVREGDLTAKARVTTRDEIGQLGESFNEMTDRIVELMEKFEQEQIEKRESVLWALRAQINPHFLYNTLDSIIWMAEAGRNEDVVEMTGALAKMLRASLSRDAEHATVAVELENVRNYLRIQKYRYGSKLQYEIDVPEELKDRRIVHLSLQPLVENAIYHGIREKREGGTVRIAVREQEGLLVVTVSDDGRGMDEARLGEVRKGEQSDKSIGLRNIDSRIKLNFGPEYGLTVESKLGAGTRVTMRIPSVRREQ